MFTRARLAYVKLYKNPTALTKFNQISFTPLRNFWKPGKSPDDDSDEAFTFMNEYQKFYKEEIKRM